MAETFNPLDPDEWVDSPGCEAFEIAADMRARGALPKEADAALDAHLSGCAPCREYASMAGTLDASLALAAATTPRPEDLRRLRDRMQARLRNVRRAPWVNGAGLALFLLGFVLLERIFGGPLISPRSLAECFVAIMVLGVGAALWKARRLHRLLQQHDVVAAYRKDLERSLRSLRHMNRWLPVVIVLSAFQALGWFARGAEGDLAGGPIATAYGVGFILGVFGLVQQRRAARRMARELAELH